MFISPFRNILQSLAFVALAAAPMAGQAETFSFLTETDGFHPAPSLDSVLSGASLDYMVTGNTAGTTSSHILVTGMVPVGSSTTVYTGDYRGVDLSTGNESDMGKVVLTLPNPVSVPEGSVSSPIVAVIPRSGDWPDSMPSGNPLSGYNGNSTGDTTEQTLTLSVETDTATYSGTANYTVIDQNTLELDGFTLSDGSNSWQMESTTLDRVNVDLQGYLSVSDPSNATDMEVTSLHLSALPDQDTDLIPDFMDEDVGPVPTWTPTTTGEYVLNPRTFGWFYNDDNEWSYAEGTGWIFRRDFPWFYHPNWGWVYFLERERNSAKTYLFLEAGNTWLEANFGNTKSRAKWFYAFEQDKWGDWTDPEPADENNLHFSEL
ncbi:MAG: hypothetical protein E1N59_1750 [Puniceicoccaceae bacterium 5H]|nr:MAG: hypothetical protein E1N59_1750 [Puniceicoccaceae bacterium 5H]